MTKLVIVFGLMVFASVATRPTVVGAALESPIYGRWNLDGGLSYFSFDPDLPRDLTNHETHPDDKPFLKGAAGSTPLTDVNASFFDVGLSRSFPVTESGMTAVLLKYTLKIPLQEDGREEMQNENDFRPPENGSFIYSKIVDISLAHEVGVGLGFGSMPMNNGEGTGNYWELLPSVNLGYWEMEYEKGWNRFGRDQASIRTAASGFSLSPRLQITFGGPRIFVSAGVAYRAMRLEYDVDILDESAPSGWEASAAIGVRL